MDYIVPVDESDTNALIFPTEIIYHIYHILRFVSPEELIRLQIVRILLPSGFSLTDSYIAESIGFSAASRYHQRSKILGHHIR